MVGWLRHAVAFVIVNAFLIGVWAMTSGSADELRDGTDPLDALDPTFWPIWPILGWGLFLGLHLALAPGSRRRRKKRARAKEAEALAQASPSDIPQMPATPVPPPAPSTSPAPPTSSSGGPDTAPTRTSSRWVTLLFSDLVGSTTLNETLGDEAYASVIDEHRQAVRDVVARQGGDVRGTQGDGFLVAFYSPIDAVTAACEIQRRSERERSAGRFVPEVRIGLHAGDTIEHDDDLLGTVVNVAARVCAEASGDQILATEPVAERVAGRVSLVDRGLVPLKGVTAPRHLFEIDWDDRHVFEHEDV